MPRVKGPLFSVSASGVYENTLEFRASNGKNIVARKRKAPPGRSPAQQAQQTRISTAMQGWRDATTAQRIAWKTAANNNGLNGYQLYLREYLAQNITPPTQPTIP